MSTRFTSILSFVMALGLVGSVALGDITSDLVGYWPLDGDASDASGNGLDGEILGNVVPAEDRQGNPDAAMLFPGARSAYIELGDPPELQITGAMTLAAWIRIDSYDANGRIIARIGGSNARSFSLNIESDTYGRVGAFQVAAAGSDPVICDTVEALPFTPDDWVHIAGTYEPGVAMRIYIDGQLDEEVTSGVPVQQHIGNTVRIGKSGTSWGEFAGSIDDVYVFNRALSESDIRQLYKGSIGLASDASPVNTASDVPRDVSLNWQPGEFAVTHDVYFGMVFTDVNDANRDDPLGMLASEGQDATSHDTGRLDFGQTYYWRVDEVNGAPDFTVSPGEVWSFTVEPISYPIAGVTASASSSHAADMGPEKTVDGSGLNDMDQHSTLAPTMWLSGMGDPTPSIQYAFDKAYKLHQMQVWNSNQAIEVFVGLGAKDVTIETSLDGTTWTLLEGATLFNQATGTANYTANTTIDFAGTMAKHVRIAINSGHGMVAQYGLSEVRFMFMPTIAREPQPEDGALMDGVDVTLGWRAGRNVATHEVVLSSDLAAVEDGSAVIGTVQDSSFVPDSINYGSTYYWQINEVNEAETPSRHAGDIWSFSTPEYLVVDDFESYNDDCDRIFFAWQDGFGHNGSEGIEGCAVAPYNGNGTGSIVGHASAPFAEQAIVQSGQQSMPLEYDSGVSETTLALDAQNWAVNGIQWLALSFHGALDNTGQLYLKINGTEVLFDGNGALSRPFWSLWNVELGAVGTDLTRVTALTIGIKGASAPGMVYIDDIQLHAQAPEGLAPQDPGSANLVAYYALENNAQDGSGNAHHGTLEGNPLWITPGWNGTGACMQFGGNSQRITVESFDVTGSGITLAAWIKPILFLNDARMISKSEGGGTEFHYWAMVLSGSGEDNLQFRLRTDAGNTTSRTSSGHPLTLEEWTHVALAWDASDPVMRQYKNGQEIDSVNKAGSAVATGPGVKIGIGNQSISALAQGPGNEIRPFEGLMDEVRVYSRGLSVPELLYIVSGQ